MHALHYCICIAAVLLVACQSSPPKSLQYQQPIEMQNLKGQNEPCWVKNPQCVGDAQKYLYFVGEADKAYDSHGRPPRKAFRAAQSDAEYQYVKYLGTRISSTLNHSVSSLDSDIKKKQELATQEFVRGVIDSFQKQDEYYISYSETDSGKPEWHVFVLYRIQTKSVEKHREQVIELLGGLETQHPYDSARLANSSSNLETGDNPWVITKNSNYNTEAIRDGERLTLKYSGKGADTPRVMGSKTFPAHSVNQTLTVELSLTDNQQIGLPELEITLEREGMALSRIVYTGDDYYEASDSAPTLIRDVSIYGKKRIETKLADLLSRITTNIIPSDIVKVSAKVAPPPSTFCSQCQISIYSLKIQ